MPDEYNEQSTGWWWVMHEGRQYTFAHRRDAEQFLEEIENENDDHDDSD